MNKKKGKLGKPREDSELKEGEVREKGNGSGGGHDGGKRERMSVRKEEIEGKKEEGGINLKSEAIGRVQRVGWEMERKNRG